MCGFRKTYQLPLTRTYKNKSTIHKCDCFDWKIKKKRKNMWHVYILSDAWYRIVFQDFSLYNCITSSPIEGRIQSHEGRREPPSTLPRVFNASLRRFHMLAHRSVKIRDHQGLKCILYCYNWTTISLTMNVLPLKRLVENFTPLTGSVFQSSSQYSTSLFRH